MVIKTINIMNKIAINKETVKILVLRNEHPAPWYLKIKKGKRYFDWKMHSD